MSFNDLQGFSRHPIKFWPLPLLVTRASLLGARTLLGAPGLTTRSKDATNRAKGIATSSKDAAPSGPPLLPRPHDLACTRRDVRLAAAGDDANPNVGKYLQDPGTVGGEKAMNFESLEWIEGVTLNTLAGI